MQMIRMKSAIHESIYLLHMNSIRTVSSVFIIHNHTSNDLTID